MVGIVGNLLVLAGASVSVPIASTAALPVLTLTSGQKIPVQSLDREDLKLLRDAIIPRRETALPVLPDSPFRSSLPGATSKRQAFDLHWNGGRLHIASLRAKSLRTRATNTVFRFNRAALLEVDGFAAQSLGRHDSIAALAGFALERRRPALFVGQHNIYQTRHLSLALDWTHDDRFSLSAGMFSVGPSGGRSFADRQVEVAGGAPLAMHGIALVATVAPIRDPAKFSFGLDLRRARYAAGDAELIGDASGRRDSRIALFLRRAF